MISLINKFDNDIFTVGDEVIIKIFARQVGDLELISFPKLVHFLS